MIACGTLGGGCDFPSLIFPVGVDVLLFRLKSCGLRRSFIFLAESRVRARWHPCSSLVRRSPRLWFSAKRCEVGVIVSGRSFLSALHIDVGRYLTLLCLFSVLSLLRRYAWIRRGGLGLALTRSFSLCRRQFAPVATSASLLFSSSVLILCLSLVDDLCRRRASVSVDFTTS